MRLPAILVCEGCCSRVLNFGRLSIVLRNNGSLAIAETAAKAKNPANTEVFTIGVLNISPGTAIDCVKRWRHIPGARISSGSRIRAA